MYPFAPVQIAHRHSTQRLVFDDELRNDPRHATITAAGRVTYAGVPRDIGLISELGRKRGVGLRVTCGAT